MMVTLNKKEAIKRCEMLLLTASIIAPVKVILSEEKTVWVISDEEYQTLKALGFKGTGKGLNVKNIRISLND